MAQEYEQPVDKIASPLPQRMTAAESRAVIDLWQQEQVEQTGLTDKPALPDVAEGLDITVEDVQRLLLEVRARRLEEERSLIAEQELSEIRLAEEERKLAEIRRQQAELRRQQAEKQRGQAAVIRPRQTVQYPERYTNHAKKPKKIGYFHVALILVFTLILATHKPDVPQILQATNAVTISHESAVYDAQGQIKSFNVVCADSEGRVIACGEDITATEKQHLQDQHNQEPAKARNVVAKNKYDKQTHRGSN